MKNKKIIVLIIIVLILLGVGVYFLVNKDITKEVETKQEEKVENKMYYNEQEDTYYDGKGNYYTKTDEDGMYYNEESDTYFKIAK